MGHILSWSGSWQFSYLQLNLAVVLELFFLFSSSVFQYFVSLINTRVQKQQFVLLKVEPREQDFEVILPDISYISAKWNCPWSVFGSVHGLTRWATTIRASASNLLTVRHWACSVCGASKGELAGLWCVVWRDKTVGSKHCLGTYFDMDTMQNAGWKRKSPADDAVTHRSWMSRHIADVYVPHVGWQLKKEEELVAFSEIFIVSPAGDNLCTSFVIVGLLLHTERHLLCEEMRTSVSAPKL